jgi:hypothetical protein
VAAEEVLGARDDLTEHNGGTEGVHNVLVIGVEHEALSYPTCNYTLS